VILPVIYSSDSRVMSSRGIVVKAMDSHSAVTVIKLLTNELE